MSRSGQSGGETYTDMTAGGVDRPRSGLVAGLLAGLVALFVLASGFGVFVSRVNGAVVPDAVRADAIVVLTGGRARLDPAVQLLLEGRGERLLVSGVNGDLPRDTLRKTLGLDATQFECCVDVDRAALDTIGNAEASALWVKTNGFESLIVVTNDYHMPRAMMEFRRLLPGTDLVAYPVKNGITDFNDPLKHMDRYRVLAGEYAKFLLASVRALFPSGNGLVAQAGMAAGW